MKFNNVPYIMIAVLKKKKIFFNAAPYDESIQNYPIEKVTWLVVNETEGAALSGKKFNEKILQVLKQKYPHTNILLQWEKMEAEF